MVRWIRMFFNLPYPKGNNPSKFQLTEVRRFGGVRDQTNKRTDKLTHWQTGALIEIYLFALSALQRNFSTTHPLGLFFTTATQTLSSLPSILALRDKNFTGLFYIFSPRGRGERYLVPKIQFDIYWNNMINLIFQSCHKTSSIQLLQVALGFLSNWRVLLVPMPIWGSNLIPHELHHSTITTK